MRDVWEPSDLSAATSDRITATVACPSCGQVGQIFVSHADGWVSALCSNCAWSGGARELWRSTKAQIRAEQEIAAALAGRPLMPVFRSVGVKP